MLIFDRFPTKGHAKRFAAVAGRGRKRTATVYEEPDGLGCFPFVKLEPPIVLVSVSLRDRAAEERIRKAVEDFGGVFAAGT